MAPSFWRADVYVREQGSIIGNKSSVPHYVAISNRIWWKRAEGIEPRPDSFIFFRSGNSQKLERLESDASWDNVNQVVRKSREKQHPALVIDLHHAKQTEPCDSVLPILCGSIEFKPSRRVIPSGRAELVIIPEEEVDRDQLLHAIHARIIPWQLLYRGSIEFGKLWQDSFNLSKMIDQIQSQIFPSLGAGSVLTVNSSSTKNADVFADAHLNNATESDRKMTAITVVSASFQVVALSVRLAEMAGNAKRRHKVLPQLLEKVSHLQNVITESIPSLIHPETKIQKHLLENVLEVQENSFRIMSDIEDRFMRKYVARFLFSHKLKKVEETLENLRKEVVPLALAGSSVSQFVSEKLSPPDEFPVLSERPSVSPHFTGRHDELDQLRRILNEYNSAAIMQHGGSGKTQLATAFIEQAENNRMVPGGSFWIWVSSARSDFLFKLADLAEHIRREKLNKKDRKNANLVLSFLKQGLQSIVGRWVLCLDHADHPNVNGILGEVCRMVSEETISGWVIVTSRQGGNTLWPGMSYDQKIRLSCLSAEDAMVLLLRWKSDTILDDAEIEHRIQNLDITEFDALQELSGDAKPSSLGGLPLALAQAGLYISHHGISFRQFAALYRETRQNSGVRSLFSTCELLHESDKPVWKTWKADFERLSETAREIALALALLDSGPISEIFFRNLGGKWGSELLPYVELMEDLVFRSSLLNTGDLAGGLVLRMHRMIRDFIIRRARSHVPSFNNAFIRSCTALHGWISHELLRNGESMLSPPYIKRSREFELHKHTSSLLCHFHGMGAIHGVGDRFKMKLLNLYRYLIRGSNPNVFEFKAPLDKDTSLLTAEILYVRGLITLRDGDLDGAERLQRKCLSTFNVIDPLEAEALRSCENPLVADVIQELAFVELMRGNLKLAESLFHQCITIVQRLIDHEADLPSAIMLLELAYAWRSTESSRREVEVERICRICAGIFHSGRSTFDIFTEFEEKNYGELSSSIEIIKKLAGAALDRQFKNITTKETRSSEIELQPVEKERDYIRKTKQTKLSEIEPQLEGKASSEKPKNTSSIEIEQQLMGCVRSKFETVATKTTVVSPDFMFLLLLTNVGTLIRECYPLHSSQTLRSKLIDLMPRVDFFSPFDIEEMHNMKLSQYLALEKELFFPFIDCIRDLSAVHRFVKLLPESAWSVEFPTTSERRFFVHKHDFSSFLIVIDDFFLAYNNADGAFRALVPGAPFLRFEKSTLEKHPNFFESLIESEVPISIQQVFLLVRRFVQFTDAHWDYRCFAIMEKNVHGADNLRLLREGLFPDIIIELHPMSFSCFSRCEVGVLPVELHERYYSAAVKVFGSVIGFERPKKHICRPELISDSDLSVTGDGNGFVSNEQHTDDFDFLIGGNHPSCMNLEQEGDTVEVDQHTAPPREASSTNNPSCPFLRCSIQVGSKKPKIAWVFISNCVHWKVIKNEREKPPSRLSEFLYGRMLHPKRLENEQWDAVERCVRRTESGGLEVVGVERRRNAIGEKKDYERTVIIEECAERVDVWIDCLRSVIAPSSLLSQQFKEKLYDNPVSNIALQAWVSSSTGALTSAADDPKAIIAFLQTLGKKVHEKLLPFRRDEVMYQFVISSLFLASSLCLTLLDVGMDVNDEISRKLKSLPKETAKAMVVVLHPAGSVRLVDVENVISAQKNLLEELKKIEMKMAKNRVGDLFTADDLLQIEPGIDNLTNCIETLRTKGTLPNYPGRPRKLFFATSKINVTELEVHRVGNSPIFNLAYLPKNYKFNLLNDDDRYYTLPAQAGSLTEDLRSLGYGDELSRLIRQSAVLYGKGSVTLAEAQHYLLMHWETLYETSAEPVILTMKPPECKTIPAYERVLVLNGETLHIMKSTKVIARSKTFGQTVGITTRIFEPFGLTYSENTGTGVTTSDSELLTRTTVSSMVDTVQKLSRGKIGAFRAFTDGLGKKPQPKNLEAVGCYILFISAFLRNRVRPKGRFKDCVVLRNGDTFDGKQLFDFDLPMPSGVVASTLAASVRDQTHSLFIQGEWDLNHDFTSPVLIGAGESDTELQAWANEVTEAKSSSNDRTPDTQFEKERTSMIWKTKVKEDNGNRQQIARQLGTLFNDESTNYSQMNARALMYKVKGLTPETCSPALDMLRFRVLKSERDALFLTTKMKELVEMYFPGDSLHTYSSLLMTVRCAVNLFHWQRSEVAAMSADTENRSVFVECAIDAIDHRFDTIQLAGAYLALNIVGAPSRQTTIAPIEDNDAKRIAAALGKKLSKNASSSSSRRVTSNVLQALAVLVDDNRNIAQYVRGLNLDLARHVGAFDDEHDLVAKEVLQSVMDSPNDDTDEEPTRKAATRELWKTATKLNLGDAQIIAERLRIRHNIEVTSDLGAISLMYHLDSSMPEGRTPILDMLRLKVLESESDACFVIRKMKKLFELADPEIHDCFQMAVSCAVNVFQWPRSEIAAMSQENRALFVEYAINALDHACEAVQLSGACLALNIVGASSRKTNITPIESTYAVQLASALRGRLILSTPNPSSRTVASAVVRALAVLLDDDDGTALHIRNISLPLENHTSALHDENDKVALQVLRSVLVGLESESEMADIGNIEEERPNLDTRRNFIALHHPQARVIEEVVSVHSLVNST